MNGQLETATLAGGCFWCLEAVYELLRGVEHVESGYVGGAAAYPTYEEVCSGTTGHAEAVRIEFDQAQISYRDLLDVFFTIHDPTTLNRQGADIGTQYRSAIFTHSEEQASAAREAIAAQATSGHWRGSIVTTVEPCPMFYPAEAHHQQYFRNNPYQGYCQVVVEPKVAKARAKFFERLKASGVSG
jgi:peptide-methionine (S)-S-oxide reductase